MLTNAFNDHVQNRPLEQKKKQKVPKEKVKEEGHLSDIFGGAATWGSGDINLTYSFNLETGVPEGKEPTKDKTQDKGRERTRRHDPDS